MRIVVVLPQPLGLTRSYQGTSSFSPAKSSTSAGQFLRNRKMVWKMLRSAPLGASPRIR